MKLNGLDVNGTMNCTTLSVGGVAFTEGKWDDGSTSGEIYYNGGNVGIGTGSTRHNNVPPEKLTVMGAIKIGDSTQTGNGTIRWTGSDFEGRKGGAWVTLTASGGGSSVWSTSGSTATYANKVEINKSDSDGLLTLTAGQGAGASTANQIRLGYNGGKSYMHSIKTNHHGGQASGNSIHFYVWNQGNIKYLNIRCNNFVFFFS